jgi:hypothetical protein
MKRAKGTRKAPIDPTVQVRDLAVTPAAGAGVKGGDEKRTTPAAPVLVKATASGTHFQTAIITV